MQSAAQAKKARRETRNKARRNGDPMGLLSENCYPVDGLVGGDMLLAAQRRAENKFNLINALDKAILTGTPQEKLEAAKRKRKMNDSWFNRDIVPGDFFKPEGGAVTRGKEKQRGKSIPLIKSF